MCHNYAVGNIVKLKSNGQVMRINSVLKNPFDEELSGYIVCEWVEDGERFKRTLPVDAVEFVSVGDAKPYDVDDNPQSSWW